MQLYTLGHSNRTLDEVMSLIGSHRISVVVDVRSRPFSRFRQFNQQALSAFLRRNAVDYKYLGQALGGIPHGVSDAEDTVGWRQGVLNPLVVKQLRASPSWGRGLENLASVIHGAALRGGVACLLCSEADPKECHRRVVALDTLKLIPDLRVTHIIAPNKILEQEQGFQELLI